MPAALFLGLLFVCVLLWLVYTAKGERTPAAFEDTRDLAIALSGYRNQELDLPGDQFAIEASFHDDPQLWQQLSEGAEPKGVLLPPVLLA